MTLPSLIQSKNTTATCLVALNYAFSPFFFFQAAESSGSLENPRSAGGQSDPWEGPHWASSAGQLIRAHRSQIDSTLVYKMH